MRVDIYVPVTEAESCSRNAHVLIASSNDEKSADGVRVDMYVRVTAAESCSRNAHILIARRNDEKAADGVSFPLPLVRVVSVVGATACASSWQSGSMSLQPFHRRKSP